MSLVIAESFATRLTLSTRLVYELGDPRSTLRATTDRNGEAVVIHAGGEIDACNEHTWQQLVSEAAAGITAAAPLVVDVNDVDFMGCCAFAVLADEADRCRRRGVELRVVSGHAIVKRIVDACGLTDQLPTYQTVDEALLAPLS